MLVNLITIELREIRDNESVRNGEDKDENVAIVLTTHQAALKALETLRDYLQSNSGNV